MKGTHLALDRSGTVRNLATFMRVLASLEEPGPIERKEMHAATRSICSVALLLTLAFHQEPARADDVMVGRFASETRANFGSDTFGEYRIEITRKGSKYAISTLVNGRLGGPREVFPCRGDSPAGYFRNHPPGEVRALCLSPLDFTPIFFYSENGMRSPVDPRKVYKTKYYAELGGLFYGYRKLR